MTTSITLSLVVVLVSLLIFLWRRLRLYVRQDFVRRFLFAPSIFVKLKERHPHLSAKDRQLVAQGLRSYFLACSRAGDKPLAIPSKVAADLWLEFMVDKQRYHEFCDKAFGQFIHQTPAIVLGSNPDNNTALGLCWYFCCIEANIDPRKPTRLPLLFALDAKLKITDGNHYEANRVNRINGDGDDGPSAIYYGAAFAMGGFPGSSEGWDGNDGGDSDGGGDGGGD